MILAALIRSIPNVGRVVVLLGIVLYGYAFAGQQSFGEHAPAYWGNLVVSVLSLPQIVTLDDWATIMGTAIELEP